jgi:lysyl-tRNA synthetase class 2
VVGASPAAMRAYRAAGMHAVKIGEEAVIPLPAFRRASLAKRVRRAARSIAAHGIVIHIGAMADLNPALTAQCAAVSRAWLGSHGGAEQGFSMTSGPLPAPDDRDHQMVLGVLPGEAGAPGRLFGFLSLAPVPAGRGLSLDHMRRLPDAPNGLMEALIIAAAEHFRDAGYLSLSLNFAALCDKECPEGEHAVPRAARAAIFEGARHLPLRSLYRFNKKFDPQWSCRYWLYASADRLPAAAYATVRAEVSAPFLIPGPFGAALRAR